MRRALAIDETSLGLDHPEVARELNNLAGLLRITNRQAEAEPLVRRALAIDEKSLGLGHPTVALRLHNLAQVLQDSNRLIEAEPPMRRALAIFVEFTHRTGYRHPHLDAAFANYANLLAAMGKSQAEVDASCAALMGPSS
jgi:tetratricopeptide (TPR) repeat protein